MGASIEAACEAALSRFDFATVAKLYQALEWEWTGIGVPGEASLRICAKELCGGLLTPPMERCSMRTGGLVASLSEDEEGWTVRLEFVAVGATSDTFQATD